MGEKMNKKEKIKKLKEKAIVIFGLVCAVCYKKKKVMQYHHLEYHEGELTYKDFKNNDDYQLYILPIIIERPEEFRRVCRSDHWKLTMATRNDEARETFERFATVVRETR